MISERGLHTNNDIRVCEGDKSLFVASKKAHYTKLAPPSLLVYQRFLMALQSEQSDPGNTPDRADSSQAESCSLSHSLMLHLQVSALGIWEYFASHRKSYYVKENASGSQAKQSILLCNSKDPNRWPC